MFSNLFGNFTVVIKGIENSYILFATWGLWNSFLFNFFKYNILNSMIMHQIDKNKYLYKIPFGIQGKGIKKYYARRQNSWLSITIVEYLIIFFNRKFMLKTIYK